MSETNEQLILKARGRREQARQARRLSLSVLAEEDAARLLRYAERQDFAAQRLECAARTQCEQA